MKNNWLLLVYKIPREPTAGRVYVWRKLKQLGAISLQDAAWVLPANSRTREQFQWLASEIVELSGEASLFVSELAFASDETSLRERFEAPVVEAYKKMLSALKGRRPDLVALSKRYQQMKQLDYFQSPWGERVRDRLLAIERGAVK
jgi:hypothetical protein